nr:TSUP family transporter [Microbacterium pseudoresistens]
MSTPILLLVVVGLSTVIAAVIQRITGLAFVLVLLGPVVLVYGAVEGVTLAVLLAVIAAATAIPSAWRDVDWRRATWLLAAGLIAAPLGALVSRMLPEPALLLLIAAMAIMALLAPRLGAIAARALHGRTGALAAGAAAGFMHASSGLSGPPLAAFAMGDRWDQRRFAASAQVIFLVFGVVSVLLRGLPESSPVDVSILAVCTAAGSLLGAALVRRVPIAFARAAMLWCAWAGTVVVLVRGILALTA